MSTKLIRLATDDESCIFDSQYDEDIVLEPNSQIAVHSCNFQTHSVVQVDEINNTITFQASPTVVEGNPTVDAASPIHTVSLTNGTYSVGNMRVLLQDIERKMNEASRLSNTSEFGLQYQVSINNLNKVAFKGFRDEVIQMADSGSITRVVYKGIDQPTTADDILVAAGDPNPAVRDINHAVAYCETPFVKGCGVHRAQIANMSADGSNGFMIGLTANIGALRTGTLSRSDIECAIELQDRGGTYIFKESVDGNMVASAIAPYRYETATITTNDIVEIAMEQGIVGLNVHNANAGGTSFNLGSYSYDFDAKKDLYAFLSIYRGATKMAVHRLELNVDPYFQINAKNKVGGGHAHTGFSSALYPVPAYGGTTYKLQTDNHPTIASALGFGNKRNPNTHPVYGGPSLIYNVFGHDLGDHAAGHIDSVEGKRMFSSINADNYLVELLNFPVQSYDSYDNYGTSGSKRGRANIIETIPVNESTGAAATLGIIQYQPNTPTYINLSNKEQRLFRNIRARITHADYSPVASVGMSTLTLLLRNN